MPSKSFEPLKTRKINGIIMMTSCILQDNLLTLETGKLMERMVTRPAIEKTFILRTQSRLIKFIKDTQ